MVEKERPKPRTADTWEELNKKSPYFHALSHREADEEYIKTW